MQKRRDSCSPVRRPLRPPAPRSGPGRTWATRGTQRSFTSHDTHNCLFGRARPHPSRFPTFPYRTKPFSAPRYPDVRTDFCRSVPVQLWTAVRSTVVSRQGVGRRPGSGRPQTAVTRPPPSTHIHRSTFRPRCQTSNYRSRFFSWLQEEVLFYASAPRHRLVHSLVHNQWGAL